MIHADYTYHLFYDCDKVTILLYRNIGDCKYKKRLHMMAEAFMRQSLSYILKSKS
jgi:hypothetical protein